MKCPKCGGRRFSYIARYVKDVEYDKDDDVLTSDLEEGLDPEEDSHYCLGCDTELKDSELVKENS